MLWAFSSSHERERRKSAMHGNPRSIKCRLHKRCRLQNEEFLQQKIHENSFASLKRDGTWRSSQLCHFLPSLGSFEKRLWSFRGSDHLDFLMLLLPQKITLDWCQWREEVSDGNKEDRCISFSILFNCPAENFHLPPRIDRFAKHKIGKTNFLTENSKVIEGNTRVKGNIEASSPPPTFFPSIPSLNYCPHRHLIPLPQRLDIPNFSISGNFILVQTRPSRSVEKKDHPLSGEAITVKCNFPLSFDSSPFAHTFLRSPPPPFTNVRNTRRGDSKSLSSYPFVKPRPLSVVGQFSILFPAMGKMTSATAGNLPAKQQVASVQSWQPLNRFASASHFCPPNHPRGGLRSLHPSLLPPPCLLWIDNDHPFLLAVSFSCVEPLEGRLKETNYAVEEWFRASKLASNQRETNDSQPTNRPKSHQPTNQHASELPHSFRREKSRATCNFQEPKILKHWHFFPFFLTCQLRITISYFLLHPDIKMSF